MDPRPHHFDFAKKDLPNLAFSSFDKMVQELTGPRREAFLMFLWQEAGKRYGQQVSPVTLDTIGALQRMGVEIVVIRMPPAVAPNEAVFVALVRTQGEVRVYFYERCRDAHGNIAPNECVLSCVTPGQRSNLGFFQGDALEDFKQNLGRVLGISLDGLEQSLQPVSMAAFVGAAQHPYAPRQADPIAMAYGGLYSKPTAPQRHAYDPYAFGAQPRPMAASPHPKGLGQTLEIVLIIRAILPVVSFLGGFVLHLGAPLGALETLVTLTAIVIFFIWLYRIFDSRRGQTRYTPGMAIGAWFIPFANFIFPPMIVNDAWKAVRGDQNLVLIALWWVAWIAQILISFGSAAIGTFDSYGTLMIYLVFRLGAGVASYGLLWLIVRSINAKA